MDNRIVQSMEAWLGCSVDSKSKGEIQLIPTSSRTDSPCNRLVISRIIGQNTVIATCIPRLVDGLGHVLNSLTEWELFSEYGMATLRNHLSIEDAQDLGQGFSYAKFQTDSSVEESSDCIVRKINESGTVLGFEYIVNNEVISSVEFARRDAFGTIAINVDTKEDYRGKGYGTAVVRAATDWILTNGFIPRYGANVNNTISLSIVRKLQYELVSQHIVC